MQWKLAGCLLTLLAFGGGGYHLAYCRDEKRRQLVECKSLLFFLRDSIRYGHESLPNVFSQIRMKKSNSIMGTFYGNVAARIRSGDEVLPAIWKEEVDRLSKNSKMSVEDLDAFADLGNYLGGMDVTAQYDRILFCIERMNERIETIRQENCQKIRLYRLLGVMSGIFVDILLL